MSACLKGVRCTHLRRPFTLFVLVLMILLTTTVVKKQNPSVD